MRISMVVLICLLLVIPCTAEVIVCFPMDSDPDWTTEGQWEFGVPQGGGGPQSYDPTSGYTDANVYGYNLAGNYENDIAEYRLTTSALNCALAENVTLSFWRWLGVESSLYDRAKIQVSNDGTNWTGVWFNGAGNLTDISWVYCEYDISAVADRQPTVFVRWCMGPTDFSIAYAGWNIDDVCLDGDLLDALVISPNDVFLSAGPEGGPFEPPCKTYTLTNNGTSTLNWMAEATESWLEIIPGSGTLAPDDSIVVYVCIGANANSLTEGRYTDTVRFTNTNSGFSYSIDVTLCVGVDIVVPLQYSTIQSAINASSNGDTILVLDGIYTGDGNKDIDFKGKRITLRSLNGPESCIIDYGYDGGFNFHSGEDSNSILDGFTITGRRSGGDGGIYCNNSSPSISNCTVNDSRDKGFYCRNNSHPVITNCTITNSNPHGMYNDNSSPTVTNCTFSGNYGHGMYNVNSSPAVTNCTFSNNGKNRNNAAMHNDNSSPTVTNCTFSENLARGMYNDHSNPTLFNCIFSGNEKSGNGGGIYCAYSNPTLTNCTFVGNEAGAVCDMFGCYAGYGGGMYNDNGKPVITNCIFWANSAYFADTDQIYTGGVGGLVINYSCIQSWTGGLGGSGNIGTDPCFADSSNDGYHLKSKAGRWDANSESWVTDANTSVCIDAGNPGCPTGSEPLPNGNRINMGAYGGTPTASKSPADWHSIADLTNDWVVDFNDLKVFVDYWLETDQCLPGDLNRTQAVDFTDFAIFADNWHWEQ